MMISVVCFSQGAAGLHVTLHGDRFGAGSGPGFSSNPPWGGNDPVPAETL